MLAGIRDGVATRLMAAFILATVVTAACAQPVLVATDPDARATLISPLLVARLSASRSMPVLFDVREEIEFAVSHLPGAIHIPPQTDRREAVARIAAHARSRTAILYCMTAQRSRQLADAIYHDLMDAGVSNVVVMAGGIIGWANERGRLVDQFGVPTRSVHPGDAEMARLLRDRSRVRFAPPG